MADSVLTFAPEPGAKTTRTAAPEHAQAPARTPETARPASNWYRSTLPPFPALIPVHSPTKSCSQSPLLPFQRQLAIGDTADPLEAEADSMADRLMRGAGASAATPTSPVLERDGASAGTNSHWRQWDHEAERAQKLHGNAHTPAGPQEAPPIVHEALRLSRPTARRCHTSFLRTTLWVRLQPCPCAHRRARCGVRAVGECAGLYRWTQPRLWIGQVRSLHSRWTQTSGS